MPEMDGPTLLGELRKRHPDLKVIFVSGYAEDAFRKNLPEGEDFNFLPSPSACKQLVEAVKQAVAAVAGCRWARVSFSSTVPRRPAMRTKKELAHENKPGT